MVRIGNMVYIMPLKNEQINELVTRGIERIIPSQEELTGVLIGDRKLKIYLGIDPTGPKLHLGHSVPILLLRRFQKLGHRTILLIGDFTARIGDPSGRTTLRKPLTLTEIKRNLKIYKQQASRIIDFSGKNATEIKFNSSWHKRLTFGDLLKIASQFTVQQMLARDMFQERLKKEAPIGLHEFLYPIAQGYDSVALAIDAEIGGSDQLFNMLVGRELVRSYLKKEKFTVTTKLLVNPVTRAKMSKTEGSFVALNDAPSDMYGKIMAFPDEFMKECFELCTEVPMEEVDNILKLHPREAKAMLAHTIVAMYHSEDEAKKAEGEFTKIFSRDELPQDMPVVKISAKTKNIVDLLVETKLVASKNEARRLIEQGGVRIDGEVQVSGAKEIGARDGMILQIGKRRFVKIKATP